MKEKFGNVVKNAASITVANQIIEMIASGELCAGEKLPSERQLQELLKVGRPSIREALSALQIMNICETRVGDGTYISSLDSQEMTRPFEILMLLSKPKLSELFDMREALEVGAIKLATQHITDEEIDSLLTCVNCEHGLIANAEEFSRVDVAFHSIIVNASRNSLMKNVMFSIQRMAAVSRQLTSVLIEIRRQSMLDHKIIIKSLTARVVAAAETSMRNHLLNVRKGARQICDDFLTMIISPYI